MFTPQMNVADLSDALVQWMIPLNVAGGADSEARFAVACAAALDFSEQGCGTAASGTWLDPLIRDEDALVADELSTPPFTIYRLA